VFKALTGPDGSQTITEIGWGVRGGGAGRGMYSYAVAFINSSSFNIRFSGAVASEIVRWKIHYSAKKYTR